VITQNHGLKLKAKYRCKGKDGNIHEAGEEWIVTTLGFYIPDVCEELVQEVNGIILTDRKAI